MKLIKEVTTALNLFEEAALAHGIATEQGEYKIANKAHSSLARAINFLKQQGEICRLLPLLNHNSPAVRTWAARFLLPICEKDAIDTLSDISKQPGIVAFGALKTLDEWRKGNLNNT